MTDEMSDQGAAGLDPTSVTLDDGTSALALDLTGVPGFDTLVFNTPDGSQVLVSDIGEGAQLIAVDADGQGGIDRAFVAVNGYTYAVNLATGQIEGEVDSSLVPTPQAATPEPMVALPTWAQLDDQQGPTTATFPVMGPGPDLGDPTNVGTINGPGLRAHRRPDEGWLRRRPGLRAHRRPDEGWLLRPDPQLPDDRRQLAAGHDHLERSPWRCARRRGCAGGRPAGPRVGLRPAPADHRSLAERRKFDLYRAQVGVEALWTSSTHTPVPRLSDGSPMPASAVLMTLRDTYATEAEKANLSALIQDVETRERLAARLRSPPANEVRPRLRVRERCRAARRRPRRRLAQGRRLGDDCRHGRPGQPGLALRGAPRRARGPRPHRPAASLLPGVPPARARRRSSSTAAWKSSRRSHRRSSTWGSSSSPATARTAGPHQEPMSAVGSSR